MDNSNLNGNGYSDGDEHPFLKYVRQNSESGGGYGYTGRGSIRIIPTPGSAAVSGGMIGQTSGHQNLLSQLYPNLSPVFVQHTELIMNNPRVKRVEFAPDGKMASAEFFTPDEMGYDEED